MPTKKRHHKPLTLRRDVSAASIGIRQAFATNENLTEVRLRVYQAATPGAPGAPGVPKPNYTIQLFNAHVCALRMVLPYTRAPSKSGYLVMNEEIAFTYVHVQWTWQSPLLVADDDWSVAR
jgi:type VI secretion system Hcp family effector